MEEWHIPACSKTPLPFLFTPGSSFCPPSRPNTPSQASNLSESATSLHVAQHTDTVSSLSIHPQPDWRRLLFLWGEKSREPILALDAARTVVFASRTAREQCGLHTGMTLEEQWWTSLEKDWSIEEQSLEDAAGTRLYLLRTRTAPLPARTEPHVFPAIATNSPLYRKQLQTARIAAASLSHTLLLGETGCGKEVLAKAIHDSSPRKDGPFIAVNIASLPKDLLASELFGYADGAFTGAKKGGQIGKFEAANHGTLFLDEIGEMTLEHQVLLLRVLEEKKVTRLGSHTEKELDVRIIAATNRLLEEDVRNGLFRADLFYRLNVLPIRIPSLRERKEDIAALAKEFLGQLHEQYKGGPNALCETALLALHQHSWPGNIRELRNVMERAFLHAFSEARISVQHLPPEWAWTTSTEQAPQADDPSPLLRTLEKQTILQAIQDAPSMSAAAKKLGIARSTLYRKMGELGIGQLGDSRA